MGLETAIVMGVTGAAASAASAADQNRRLEGAAGTANDRFRETNRQLVQRRDALIDQTRRATINQSMQLDRQAVAVRGAARARAAAMGLSSTAGSAARLVTQVDLDRAYRAGIIAQSQADQVRAIDSDYRAGILTTQQQLDSFRLSLANAAQSPFFSAITGGMNFATTGLNIGDRVGGLWGGDS